MRSAALFAFVALFGCRDPSPPESPSRSPSSGSREAPSNATDDEAEPVDRTARGDPLRDPDMPTAAALAFRIKRFAPAELTADVSGLPESERQALDAIIEASELMDPIFDRQAWKGNYLTRKQLEADGGSLAEIRLELFEIMRGPWDRQDDHAPFVLDIPHPPGAGFYPEDLGAEEFREYVESHPERKEDLESLHTMVVRKGDDLIAVPYSEKFDYYLEPAAQKLEEAAGLTQNESLARFLRARAKAFRTDDYYESDKLWMDLDSRVGVTIGPYETYEDQLLGLKASFEAFVTVSDPAASARLAKYKSLLPAMEQNLPVPDEMRTKRGSESPIRVVDLVFSSGDARKSVQTIAFNLPNDERVRKEKGAKKVLLRNLIETKFEKILRPIGEQILKPDHAKSLSAKAFFNQVLFHELSHSLGPAYTNVDGQEKEVRLALGPTYSPLEECKADVMGAHNVLYMIERKELPVSFREPFLTTYFAGLFRSIRFGVSEAHGQGAAIQINRHLEAGAATIDEDSDRFAIDLERLESSIENLTKDLVVLQHYGDRKGVEALLAEHGRMTASIRKALAHLDDVPIDIRPIYPLAGEDSD